VTPNNRSSKEVRTREAAVFLRLVQISKRTIGSRFVQPFGHALEDLGASLGRRDGGGLELPVGLCVQVARIEGELGMGLLVACVQKIDLFAWKGVLDLRRISAWL
jgi:hypothetical protein